MQTKTNFNTFVLKLRLWINWTVVLSKDFISLGKLLWVRRWWVSTVSERSLLFLNWNLILPKHLLVFYVESYFLFIFIYLFIDLFVHFRILFYLCYQQILQIILHFLPGLLHSTCFIFRLTHLGFWIVFATQASLQVGINIFLL